MAFEFDQSGNLVQRRRGFEFDANGEMVGDEQPDSGNPYLIDADAATEPDGPEKPNLLRRYVDMDLSAGMGVVGTVQSLTNIAGADNPVSRGLDTVRGFLGSLQSEYQQNKRREHSNSMAEAAANGGIKEEIATGVTNFFDDPVNYSAEGFGSFAVGAPLRLVGAGAKVMGVGARTVAGAGYGAGIGVGAVKGSQYEEVKDYMLSQGASPEEAEAAAVEAQAYSTKNIGQHTLGAGLGAVDLLTGGDVLVAGLGKIAGAGPVKRGLIRGAQEAGTEFPQAFQEKYAGNVAAIDAGDTGRDPTAGAWGAGTQEALMGGVPGSLMGVAEGYTPTDEEKLAAGLRTQDWAAAQQRALQDQEQARIQQEQEAQAKSERDNVRAAYAGQLPYAEFKKQFVEQALAEQVSPEAIDEEYQAAFRDAVANEAPPPDRAKFEKDYRKNAAKEIGKADEAITAAYYQALDNMAAEDIEFQRRSDSVDADRAQFTRGALQNQRLIEEQGQLPQNISLDVRPKKPYTPEFPDVHAEAQAKGVPFTGVNRQQSFGTANVGGEQALNPAGSGKLPTRGAAVTVAKPTKTAGRPVKMQEVNASIKSAADQGLVADDEAAALRTKLRDNRTQANYQAVQAELDRIVAMREPKIPSDMEQAVKSLTEKAQARQNKQASTTTASGEVRTLSPEEIALQYNQGDANGVQATAQVPAQVDAQGRNGQEGNPAARADRVAQGETGRGRVQAAPAPGLNAEKDAAESREREKAAVVAMLDKLTDRQRRILTMYHFDKLAFQQIGEELAAETKRDKPFTRAYVSQEHGRALSRLLELGAPLGLTKERLEIYFPDESRKLSGGADVKTGNVAELLQSGAAMHVKDGALSQGLVDQGAQDGGDGSAPKDAAADEETGADRRVRVDTALARVEFADDEQFDEGFAGERGAGEQEAYTELDLPDTAAIRWVDHTGAPIQQVDIDDAAEEYNAELEDGDIPFEELAEADQVRWVRAYIAYMDKAIDAATFKLKIFGDIADGQKAQPAAAVGAAEKGPAVEAVQGNVPQRDAGEAGSPAGQRDDGRNAQAESAQGVKDPLEKRVEALRPRLTDKQSASLDRLIARLQDGDITPDRFKDELDGLEQRAAPEVREAADGESAQGTTREAFLAAIGPLLMGRQLPHWINLHDTADDATAGGTRNAHVSSRTVAWVQGKNAHFILDRVKPGRELAYFLHEVGAHLGLKGLLPEQTYTKLIGQIKEWYLTGEGIEGKAANVAVKKAQAVGLVDQFGMPLEGKEDQANDEILAYFIQDAVERGVDPTAMAYKTALTRWFRTLWAAFKVAIRKLDLNPETLTARNVVDLAYGAAKLELTGTWHGTAADFRKFNHDYMGTGEGAQAFGWGTYLAQRAGIAKGYWEADVRRKSGALWDDEPPEGSLMRVDVNAQDDELLDWDKPLSEQSEKVKKALDNFFDVATMLRDAPDIPGHDIYNSLASGEPKMKGSDKAASEYLDSIGIKGIKFLDAQSRGASDKVAVNGSTDINDWPDDGYTSRSGMMGAQRHLTRAKGDLDTAIAEAADEAAELQDPYFKDQAEDAVRYLKQLKTAGAKIEFKAPDRTRNLVIFNDKNVFRVATERGARKDDIRFANDYGFDKTPSGAFASLGEAVDEFMVNPRTALDKAKLGWMTLEQMAARTDLASLKGYITTVHKMQADARDIEARAAEIDRDWVKLGDANSARLGDVMVRSTLMGYDPTAKDAPANAEQSRLKVDLRAIPGGAEMYAKVRDFYKDLNDEKRQVITDAAKASGKTDKEVARLFAEVKGPYFPLMRMGDWYAVLMSAEVRNLTAKQREGTISKAEEAQLATLRKDPKHYQTKSFDSRRDAEKFAKQSGFAHSYVNTQRERISRDVAALPDFAKFRAYIGAEFDSATRAKLDEMMAEMYFDMLPQTSGLKQQMKREGIHGATFGRSEFARSAIAQAHVVSRLKHADALSEAMVKIDRDADGGGVDARLVYNELQKRNALAMDTNAPAQWVQIATTGSYFAHLGVSPAYWLTNASQVPMITLPWLAARHGFGDTNQALAKAMADVHGIVKSSLKAGSWRFEFDWRGKFPEGTGEHEMFKRLLERSKLDITIENDLVAVADGRHTKLTDAVKFLNTPVRTIELYNRGITGLAAYRLALKKFDGDQEKAIEHAIRAVNDTQLDYSGLNAARHMNSVLGSKSLARVMMQFRKYQQGMIYLISSSAYDAVKAADPDVKREARQTLFGLFATTGLMAGSLGLPAAGTVAMIANIIGQAFDDDDDPFDAEAEWKNFIIGAAGKDMGEVLLKGLPSLVNVDASKRVGMGDTFKPTPFYRQGSNGRESANNLLAAVAGAPFGTVADIWDGIDKIGNGDVAKGMEKVVPLKLAQNAIRAARYSAEGMTDSRGNTVLPEDRFSPWDLTLRTMGFQTTEEATYYEANEVVNNAKYAALKVRARLIREATRDGHAVMNDEIREFNRRHPKERITHATLVKSLKQKRTMARERTSYGVQRSEQNKPYMEKAAFAEEGLDDDE